MSNINTRLDNFQIKQPNATLTLKLKNTCHGLTLTPDQFRRKLCDWDLELIELNKIKLTELRAFAAVLNQQYIGDSQ